MSKSKSSKRARLTADQRRARGYQIFFAAVTVIVLLSMLLSLVK